MKPSPAPAGGPAVHPPPPVEEPLWVWLDPGEEVELCGGRFRVRSLGRRFVTLEPLPGTKLESGHRRERPPR